MTAWALLDKGRSDNSRVFVLRECNSIVKGVKEMPGFRVDRIVGRTSGRFEGDDDAPW